MRKFDYDEIAEPEGNKSSKAVSVGRSAKELSEKFEEIDKKCV